MKLVTCTLFCSALLITGCATKMGNEKSGSASGNTQQVHQAVAGAAPAMAAYGDKYIDRDLWNRAGLSRRDRSLVTLAALISRNDTTDLPHYLNLALDSGVKPTEISETITHLAFYAGWPNATSAAVTTQVVFTQRHIDLSTLPGENVQLLAIDEENELKRATLVGNSFGDVSPGVVKYTTDAVFRNLWLRPGLAPRDRSLITVSALVTAGQVNQVPYHLNRAMDNGLSKEEASEVLTQLAFVAGWPNVFSALPVFRDVFKSREKS